MTLIEEVAVGLEDPFVLQARASLITVRSRLGEAMSVTERTQVAEEELPSTTTRISFPDPLTLAEVQLLRILLL